MIALATFWISPARHTRRSTRQRYTWTSRPFAHSLDFIRLGFEHAFLFSVQWHEAVGWKVADPTWTNCDERVHVFDVEFYVHTIGMMIIIGFGRERPVELLFAGSLTLWVIAFNCETPLCWFERKISSALRRVNSFFQYYKKKILNVARCSCNFRLNCLGLIRIAMTYVYLFIVLDHYGITGRA